MDTELRRKLDSITEPYDPRNPPPHWFWRTWGSIPGIFAILFLLVIVWKPIVIAARLILGL